MSAALLAQDGKTGLGHIYDAHVVGVDLVGKRVHVAVFDGRCGCVAGVVDDDVDAAVMGVPGLYGGKDICGDGYVEGEGEDVGAVLGGEG